MTEDPATVLRASQHLLNTELDHLSAEIPGTEAFLTAMDQVDARIRDVLQARQAVAARRPAELKRITRATAATAATTAFTAAMFANSAWLLAPLVPATTAGVLLTLNPVGTKHRLATGAAALAIAIPCLLFGGTFQ